MFARRARKKKAPGSMDGGFMDDSQQDSQEDDAQTTWLDVEAWNDEARQLVEHVGEGAAAAGDRASQGELVDRQGDGSETVADQGERVRVRVHRAVRGPGAYGNGVADPYAQNAATSYDDAPPAAAAQSQCRAAGDDGALRPAAPRAGGEKDDLWRDCVENPDAWWDNRSRKAEPGGNPRYPDFKHKESQTPLGSSRETRPLGRRRLANGGAVAPSRGSRVRRRRRPRRRAAAKGSTPTTLETRCRRDRGRHRVRARLLQAVRARGGRIRAC